MLIILEGNECTGKTTLANKLLTTNPSAVMRHFCKPNTDEEAYNYWRVYARAIEESDAHTITIFDRSWISDMVYGPVLRNRLEMDPEMAHMLNQYAAVRGGFIVYCQASLRTIKQRIALRGDELIKDLDTLKELQEQYTCVIKQQTGIPIFNYVTG